MLYHQNNSSLYCNRTKHNNCDVEFWPAYYY